ncbi:MAG: hypothetical protein RL684_2925 [Pseudomonadota bacterium]|jgi:predicted outer membrane repeat protein
MIRYALPSLFSAFFALVAHDAAAADFVVTTLADSGAGSLRQAIAGANATPGADRVLIQTPGTIVLTSGTLPISDSVEIIGCAGCAVQAQGGTRVFTIAGDPNEPQAKVVALRNLRLSAAASAGDGGVIRAEYARLALDNVEVRDGNAEGWGGALYADACEVDVVGSRFIDNLAGGNGGAIASNTGVLRISRSTFAGNRSEVRGGAIWANWSQDSSVVVLDSTYSDNSAAFDGGAIHAHVAELRISGSTFDANSAEYWAGGGALHIGEDGVGPMEIDNSTFIGNQALYAGAQGSAILLNSGRLRARHITVTGNKVGDNSDSGEDGGAITLGADFEARLELQNSIVAGNVQAAGSPSGLARSINPSAPNLVDARYNLIDTIPAPGTINGVDVGNQVGVQALLGAFANHGGPTHTVALLPGSPACDAAEPVTGLATDQRGAGFSRAWGPPDIGAWEHRGDTIFYGDFELHTTPNRCMR